MEDDRVTNLPFVDVPPSFPVYSGYLRPKREDGSIANLFYVFIEREDHGSESQKGSGDPPLIIWGQGGPGCSAMLGLFTEFGPWKPTRNGTLQSNPHSWNKLASLLFIDSPVGAGFSYLTNQPASATLSDDIAAKDFLAAVSLFFERFPRLHKIPFFFASESYGGHFLPQWATYALTSSLKSNFAGFLIGNPFVSWESSDLAFVHALWGRQLISMPLWSAFTSRGCADFGRFTVYSFPSDCLELLTMIISQKDSQDEPQSRLSPYDLIEPSCSDGSSQIRRALQKNSVAHGIGIGHREKILLNTGRSKSVDVNQHQDPCIEQNLVYYLNLLEVRSALHVDSRVSTWLQCSDDVFYSWPSADSNADTTKIFRRVFEKGPDLRMLVFSGDADGVCPTIGTQNWFWKTAGESRRKLISMGPWTDLTNQTGGWVVRYERQLSLATVHGAGHMVGSSSPVRALSLLANFFEPNSQLFANSTQFQVESSLQASLSDSDPIGSIFVAILVIGITVTSLLAFVLGVQKMGSRTI